MDTLQWQPQGSNHLKDACLLRNRLSVIVRVYKHGIASCALLAARLSLRAFRHYERSGTVHSALYALKRTMQTIRSHTHKAFTTFRTMLHKNVLIDSMANGRCRTCSKRSVTEAVH